jgi:peptide-methionine (S)-S-oxide reductase
LTGLTGALVLVALAWFVASPAQGMGGGGGKPVMVPPPANDAAVASAPGQQMVVFAGGCFWGIQAVFQHVKGVISATSGYSGGKAKTAEYDRVSTGMTGHVFFSVAHDPTQKNRQGPDEGTQYRSVVFYSTEEQQKITESYIAQLETAHVFKHKIVTEVVPLKAFYPAEAHHQNYATLHPDEPYIRYNDAPKVEHLKEEFPMLYASK